MIVANRYAHSLMELAIESKQLEAVRTDMKQVAELCHSHREFALFLESPLIKTDKKQEVLSAIFKGKITDLSFSFLNLIAQKHRESIIPEIAKAFDEQYKTHKNIFTAVVTSAKGLDAKTKQAMLDLISSQMKGEVELIEKVDPATIGGFVLKMGDKQIDKTVSRQLSNMKKQLTDKGLN